MWMKPPRVKEVTTPTSHKMIKITAMVYNMAIPLGL
jgi:hypothetical protein